MTLKKIEIYTILGIIIISALFLSGCTEAPQTEELDETHSDTIDESTHSEEVSEHHWGYEGEEGPDHWADLGYPDCSGVEQAPIDIPAGTSVHSADISFNYNSTALNIVNNGHSIKVEYDEGSSIEVENMTYRLLQFHFHSFSENTIMGEHSDMEMHLVHQSDTDEYAVVSVMINSGSENSAYAPIWEHMPAEEGEVETISGVNVNADDLLPVTKTYYRFDGSFTTPPCTEGVKWFLMNTSVELSTEQIDAFKKIYSNNYRPVQALNDREFY